MVMGNSEDLCFYLSFSLNKICVAFVLMKKHAHWYCLTRLWKRGRSVAFAGEFQGDIVPPCTETLEVIDRGFLSSVCFLHDKRKIFSTVFIMFSCFFVFVFDLHSGKSHFHLHNFFLTVSTLKTQQFTNHEVHCGRTHFTTCIFIYLFVFCINLQDDFHVLNSSIKIKIMLATKGICVSTISHVANQLMRQIYPHLRLDSWNPTCSYVGIPCLPFCTMILFFFFFNFWFVEKTTQSPCEKCTVIISKQLWSYRKWLCSFLKKIILFSVFYACRPWKQHFSLTF